MGNSTNVSIRIDEDLKHQAESLFSELGMNLSTAMTLFLRSAVRYGGIPFTLRLSSMPVAMDEISTADFDAKIGKAFEDAAMGKGRPAEVFFAEMEREHSL